VEGPRAGRAVRLHQGGAGWTITFWYDAHRAQEIIGYALFFVIFALERLIFGRLSAYVFRWRPRPGALQEGE
jgi:hypothetical protein